MSALAQAAYAPAPQPQPADATGQLYERHHRRIFGFCLSLLGSREDAEDAVQTTFINAQRGLHRGVVPQFELAWLFRIARNVCHDSRESASRRGRLETASDLQALQDSLATPERGASVSIGELTCALGAIPERQRRALLLREFQGLSYGEIAQELGISVAAVETLIFRARRSVAEQLQVSGKTHAGVFASALGLVRWFFQGGAAPVKLAAVAATVVTTATLAVAPAVRDHASTPAPVLPPPAGGTVAPSVQANGVGRHVLPTVTPVVNARPDVAKAAPATVPPAAAPPAVRADTPPSPVAANSASAHSTPPAATTLPNVAIPPVTTPPVNITVPEISLPQVDLPKVELSVELPKLPKLPKLP